MGKLQGVVVTIAVSFVGLFCAWQLTTQTVMTVLNANVAAQQAIHQLRACEAKAAGK